MVKKVNMAPAKHRRKFRQLTLEQSMCLSVAIDSDKASDEKPGPSNPTPTQRVSAEISESSGFLVKNWCFW